VVGLLDPTQGQLKVFGQASHAHRSATLSRVSYVAQDHPLYQDFSVADMFHLGRAMNPAWDQQLAERRVGALGIPLRRRVKALSGGQQAQVALAMALAKRAPLAWRSCCWWRARRCGRRSARTAWPDAWPVIREPAVARTRSAPS
jgi:ABC-2 type transport system ATP-binding protein